MPVKNRGQDFFPPASKGGQNKGRKEYKNCKERGGGKLPRSRRTSEMLTRWKWYPWQQLNAWIGGLKARMKITV